MDSILAVTMDTKMASDPNYWWPAFGLLDRDSKDRGELARMYTETGGDRYEKSHSKRDSPAYDVITSQRLPRRGRRLDGKAVPKESDGRRRQPRGSHRARALGWSQDTPAGRRYSTG